MNDVMLDIETYATSANAVILSIGAVRFDQETGELGEEFYINVEPGSQRWREVDPDTLEWWGRQGPAAREKLTEEPLVSLRTACIEFKKFLKKSDLLWSNGPTFDEVIIRSAFEQLGGEFPIGYYNSRCCRTEFALGKHLGVKKVTPTVKHDALADAIAQAKTVIAVRAEVNRLEALQTP